MMPSGMGYMTTVIKVLKIGDERGSFSELMERDDSAA